MFEKSLYDLIRGLRHHRGNERDYVLHSIRECRAEIRGSDMDLKATALLKLVYLEMFGHDMSWAAFNVLEVMSSSKYPQKRVGYLGAVQSFRPDTEVLMLATNLLKKDISSASVPTIALPLITLPHLVTPSLALSLQPDLVPRLAHSSPSVRKKTIVTLYRLALVHPETLRQAWPKIKDILMDEREDPSVTAAAINVVCELGWRRPEDFLPLAPRLFQLLIDGGNNWMVIKIIKLFATLTPLEPRLVKKLLPPLTDLIRTTPAMSVLYECINGIIQGGILDGTRDARESDEVAELCVGKLRAMLAVEGDPNLKYVALLAFNKVVVSHPHLVAMHQDAIMDCIDDTDISIRLQALDLSSGMINSDNLTVVVDRLVKQLRDAPFGGSEGRNTTSGKSRAIEPSADMDDDDPEEVLRPQRTSADGMPPLPDEFRIDIVRRILDMCSRDTYANVVDFEWYIDILVQLIHLVPSNGSDPAGSTPALDAHPPTTGRDVSTAVGMELRNVAVRVSSVRIHAVRAANSLLSPTGRQALFPSTGRGVLAFAAWIVGEYAGILPDPHETLGFLILPLHAPTVGLLCAHLQAVPKVLASIFVAQDEGWNAERRTMTALLLARVIHFLEPFACHPNLEVQERSVEFLELMRIASEAAAEHDAGSRSGPLLLTEAIPSLFKGQTLNPVAINAQRKVPLPDGLDLSMPINENLNRLLDQVENETEADSESLESRSFYWRRALPAAATPQYAAERLSETLRGSSYQNEDETLVDPTMSAAKRAERRERQKDDPFYIADRSENVSGTSTPLHDILKPGNGEDLDIDSIPIMKLELGPKVLGPPTSSTKRASKGLRPRQRAHVTAEETINVDDAPHEDSNLALAQTNTSRKPPTKKAFLQVDSSGLSSLSLTRDSVTSASTAPGLPQSYTDDDEMARALADVERRRMEMQRASERVLISESIPPEGTLIQKKKKKLKKPTRESSAGGPNALAGTGPELLEVAGQESPVVSKEEKKMKKKKKNKAAAVDLQT